MSYNKAAIYPIVFREDLNVLLKWFIASCAVCLLIQGHFAMERWYETLPLVDSWSYYRNFHPIRHIILVSLQWISLAAALILGGMLVERKVRR